jgi:choline dehydrogenase-like flavoprotein
MALTADRWTHGRAATLVPDAFAVKVAAVGEARSVTWRNTRTGAMTTEDAKVVVLAAGPIETPRLWLNSGLPNPNDQVGRGLTDHYLDFVVGRLPHYTGSSKGATSAARADFPGFGSIEQAGVAPGLQAQGLTDSNEPGSRVLATRLKRFVTDVDRLLAIAVLTDDDVLPENRVTLSDVMAPDAHGPIARVEIRNRSSATLARRDYLAARAIQLLKAAGAREIVRMNWAPVLLHIHTTMRMRAVVNADCESLAVERIFVADNSSLPNALGGPNPTLTTQALATRTAERIFVRYFGGDPWVGRESPVSSIDDSVTAAVVAGGL